MDALARLEVPGQELDAQPAENVVDDALGNTDIGIFSMPLRFKTHVRELADVIFQRDAILETHRNRGAEGIHQAANRAPFLGHRNEELAGPAIFVESDRDVPFVPRNRELVGE